MPDPTVTSKSLNATPTPPKPTQTVEAVIPYEQVEAKPLRQPNFVNLRHKNPNMSLYWGNRAVGEKESQLRFDQLVAMGFVPAKPENIFLSSGEACPGSLRKDGRVIYGDLILLEMPRVDYIGQLKWNEQTARMRVKKPGVMMNTGASQDMKDASQMVRDTNDARKSMAPAGFPSKVSTYVPQLAEVDAKTADNSGPTDFNLAEKS